LVEVRGLSFAEAKALQNGFAIIIMPLIAAWKYMAVGAAWIGYAST
jgi:hypothetical protein